MDELLQVQEDRLPVVHDNEFVDNLCVGRFHRIQVRTTAKKHIGRHTGGTQIDNALLENEIVEKALERCQQMTQNMSNMSRACVLY